MGIKYRSDLDSAKEGEEDVDAEYPPNRAFIVILQLVLAEVLVEDTNSIPTMSLARSFNVYIPSRKKKNHLHHPEADDRPHKTPKHNEPSLKSAFGVGNLTISRYKACFVICSLCVALFRLGRGSVASSSA
jgi:hypothetical protein